ncbi:hypothetical protein BC828DRAFT_90581 [Blastocladiella britannica]|nr:hypothetical protein BC828DRAFT_90581 [Blastocladiella britannica]
MVVVLKLRCNHESSNRNPGVPVQQVTTPIAGCLLLMFLTFQFIDDDILPMYIMFCIIALLALIITVYLAWMKQRHRELARQFDLSYLYFSMYAGMRSLNKVLSNMTPLVGPTFFPLLVVLYRCLVSWIVLLGDELVKVSFGVNNLWITFRSFVFFRCCDLSTSHPYFSYKHTYIAYRFGESIAVNHLTIQGAQSYTMAIVFAAVSLAVTTSKDAGLLDDFRFFSTYRYCIWRPPEPQAIVPETPVDPPSILKSSSVLQLPRASISASNASVNATSANATLSVPPLHVRPPSAIRDMAKLAVSFSPEILKRSFHYLDAQAATSNSQLEQLSASSSLVQLRPPTLPRTPPPGTPPITASPVYTMIADIRAQILRSEQNLFARLLCLALYLLVMLVVWAMGTQTAMQIRVDSLSFFVLGLELAEVLVARVMALWVFSAKQARLDALVATKRFGAANRRDLAVSLTSLSSNVSGGSQKRPAAAAAAEEVPLLVFWETRLPKNPLILHVLYLGCTYLTFAQYGLWG